MQLVRPTPFERRADVAINAEIADRIQDAIGRLRHVSECLIRLAANDRQRRDVAEIRDVLDLLERQTGWVVRQVQGIMVEQYEERHHGAP